MIRRAYVRLNGFIESRLICRFSVVWVILVDSHCFYMKAVFKVERTSYMLDLRSNLLNQPIWSVPVFKIVRKSITCCSYMIIIHVLGKTKKEEERRKSRRSLSIIRTCSILVRVWHQIRQVQYVGESNVDIIGSFIFCRLTQSFLHTLCWAKLTTTMTSRS